MSEKVFVRQIEIGVVEKEIFRILGDVDGGKYDSELAEAGVKRSAAPISADVEVTTAGHGMSPNEWMEIVTVFGPLSVTIASDVWKIIVVPKLKKAFRDDRVSPADPDSKK